MSECSGTWSGKKWANSRPSGFRSIWRWRTTAKHMRKRGGNAAGRNDSRRLKQRRCAELEGAARFAPCFCPNHYSLALSFYAEVHLRADNGRNLARRVPRGTDESGFWPISRVEMSPAVRERGERAPARRRPAHLRAQNEAKNVVERCSSTARLRFEAKNSV